MCQEAGTTYPSRAPGFTPVFLVRSLLNIFLVFCVMLCCLRPVCPMLPVSVSVLAGLDCPFLIAHSVFSNVYISMVNIPLPK